MKYLGQRNWAYNLYTLLMRLALAAVIFPFGANKLFGWFGGTGGDHPMVASIFQHFNLPESLATPVAIGFIVVAALLFLGFLPRIAALAVLVLAVAAMVIPGKDGLLGWYTTMQGEGMQFYLLMAVMAFTLVITGAGAIRIGSLFKNPFSRGRSSRDYPKEPYPKEPARA